METKSSICPRKNKGMLVGFPVQTVCVKLRGGRQLLCGTLGRESVFWPRVPAWLLPAGGYCRADPSWGGSHGLLLRKRLSLLAHRLLILQNQLLKSFCKDRWFCKNGTSFCKPHFSLLISWQLLQEQCRASWNNFHSTTEWALIPQTGCLAGKKNGNLKKVVRGQSVLLWR